MAEAWVQERRPAEVGELEVIRRQQPEQRWRTMVSWMVGRQEGESQVVQEQQAERVSRVAEEDTVSLPTSPAGAAAAAAAAAAVKPGNKTFIISLKPKKPSAEVQKCRSMVSSSRPCWPMQPLVSTGQRHETYPVVRQ